MNPSRFLSILISSVVLMLSLNLSAAGLNQYDAEVARISALFDAHGEITVQVNDLFRIYFGMTLDSVTFFSYTKADRRDRIIVLLLQNLRSILMTGDDGRYINARGVSIGPDDMGGTMNYSSTCNVKNGNQNQISTQSFMRMSFSDDPPVVVSEKRFAANDSLWYTQIIDINLSARIPDEKYIPALSDAFKLVYKRTKTCGY